MDIQKMQQEEAKKVNQAPLSQAVLPLLNQPDERELYVIQALIQALACLKEQTAYGNCGLSAQEMENMAELMDYPFGAMKPMQAYRQLTTWDASEPEEEQDLLNILQDAAYDLTEKQSALVRFVARNLTENRYDLSIEMP